MKSYVRLFALAVLSAAVLSSCENESENTNETTANIQSTPESESETEVGLESAETAERVEYTLPEGFVYPTTDGSTSTLPLDNAVRRAIFGDEAEPALHTKTYESLYNLVGGRCEVIFSTPLSETQREYLSENNFVHEAEPVAGEGFVFVVNRDNPVDTLTVEQIKGIYSGRITNWSEVGGCDAEIIAYQRNADSGSQNYMLSFMGDTPLMEPITEALPTAMSGILDAVANYDNGIDAIGYSVYAYSDGMYEDLAKIKYIRVDGVEPTLETLADGTYPLLGYNYAIFSADEPENSNVRALVKWMQSDEGQQVIADAGYVPYRKVEGLTLPENTGGTLYTSYGTGCEKPDDVADYQYIVKNSNSPTFLVSDELKNAVNDFVSAAEDEMNEIGEDAVINFLHTRAEYNLMHELKTSYSLVNGYLSVTVGWSYQLGWDVSPYMYYDARCAVFDIYTGERLELSDLFFKDCDFVPMLNSLLAEKSVESYSGFGRTYDMLREYGGLYEGDFEFTADSIIFRPGGYFVDGVVLSIDELREYMVTSIPRDMDGYVSSKACVFKEIYSYLKNDLGSAEEKDGVTIWFLDSGKGLLSEEVCDKLNSFAYDLFENHFSEKKRLELAAENGFDADRTEIGVYSEMMFILYGDRYVTLNGDNLLLVYKDGEIINGTIDIIPHTSNNIRFTYYFNAQTSEELTLDDIFLPGWRERTIYQSTDDNSQPETGFSLTDYTILSISDYQTPPYVYNIREKNLAFPVEVIVSDENDNRYTLQIPREFIK